MAEHIPAAALRRKPSMAQVDMLKYRKSFDLFDHQKNGTILVADFREASEKLGYRLTTGQVQKILKANKLDESNNIHFIQFIELLPKNSAQISDDEHRMAELREKFQRYDQDGQGCIRLSEASWALQMELDVAPSTALRLLNQFVRMDYNQFCEFYEKIQQKKLEIYETFGKYDEDQDGFISVDEAHKVLSKEFGFSEERSRTMVRKFDLNGDGMVSYIEFTEFYLAVEERKTRVKEMFRKFDLEGEGSVSFEQAQNVLENMLGFSSEKCRRTIEDYDKDKDGKIDYEEFAEFYTMMEQERDHLVEKFSRHEMDDQGRISLQDLKSMMQEEGCAQSSVDQITQDYDADSKINFEEFKRLLNFY
ncbi:hypothetical protein CAPTEDRAFT_218741 [Capitella teleta]|uniref:EF-hand domain-containing protein n=1 Tax=Capitella teleta TaxID=283909 RepID=X2ANQ7_CAPTE|nr:hypothetical protein CAPTEDRAFT_218741 [Capitella teleta]|eukprot:ELT90122.1 hypothetical protein CAPTEDRAFT_218741 [Capitella teleta]